MSSINEMQMQKALERLDRAREAAAQSAALASYAIARLGQYEPGGYPLDAAASGVRGHFAHGAELVYANGQDMVNRSGEAHRATDMAAWGAEWVLPAHAEIDRLNTPADHYVRDKVKGRHVFKWLRKDSIQSPILMLSVFGSIAVAALLTLAACAYALVVMPVVAWRDQAGIATIFAVMAVAAFVFAWAAYPVVQVFWRAFINCEFDPALASGGEKLMARVNRRHLGASREVLRAAAVDRKFKPYAIGVPILFLLPLAVWAWYAPGAFGSDVRNLRVFISFLAFLPAEIALGGIAAIVMNRYSMRVYGGQPPALAKGRQRARKTDGKPAAG